MAKAGKALRQVLQTYGITQAQLAEIMGIGRTVVNGWVVERRIPSSEVVPDIHKALESINSEAAEEFIRLYFEE